MKTEQSIFKAYDIRGIYPEQINEDVIYKIAQAYCKFVNPRSVVLGRDVRLSGASLFESAKQGFLDHGVDVMDIGVVSTDMLYFAVNHLGTDGGITISASHNPKEYNGMKMVRKTAQPISGDSGINDIKELVLQGYEQKAVRPGNFSSVNIVKEYIQKCLSVIDTNGIKPFKVVVNGMFGPAVKTLEQMNLPITMVKLNSEPDGNFPKGAPDPMLEQNRIETTETIIKENADLGAAWDADADRFFLFDETGRFIPGYYLTALLGEYFCKKNKNAKIIYDPRLTWATQDKVLASGGIAVINKSGHSFIKERMRTEDAVFAGEMSGHFYFRDFYHCDNGIIPFLLSLHVISKSGKKASELFDEYFASYPISGEINNKLNRPAKEILLQIEQKYPDAKKENIDGTSIEYPDWRANIRTSNTEPLIRLNVEAKDTDLLKQKTAELLSIIQQP